MVKVFFALILNVFVIFTVQADDNLQRYKDECISIIKKPQVTVTSSYGRLRYDFSKDQKFLLEETLKKFKDNNQDTIKDFAPVGLTKVRDGFDFNLTVGQVEVSQGYVCFYPSEINVHLGYYVPTIYILNSLEKDSCLYELSLRHEKTHMQIYIEALDYFLPKLKKAADGLFDNVGIIVVHKNEDLTEKAKKLNAAYLNALKEKVNRWRADVEREQLKLDTPEHYILETKLCEEVEARRKAQEAEEY